MFQLHTEKQEKNFKEVFRSVDARKTCVKKPQETVKTAQNALSGKKNAGKEKIYLSDTQRKWKKFEKK